MRLWLALPVLALAACAAESPAPSPLAGEGRDERSESGVRGRSWPLWDGQESIEQYARRAKLEPTQTLDLGGGVKMEMVLIPAGKFVMGTPEPMPVDEEAYVTNICIGLFALATGVGVLLVLLGVVVIRAIRERHRPQYSVARFLAIAFAASAGLLGGLHWYYSVRGFSDAKAEHEAAMARYEAYHDLGPFGPGWPDDEKPAHAVTLTRPYYLGRFEVSQEQYQQVMGTDPSHFKGRDLPVENVSWDDAQEFCKKASEVARSSGSRGDPVGRPTVIRLPTEAEWEHACRAGTRTMYYTGDGEADLDRAAWYRTNGNDTTHSIGQKTPNAWNLYDMHGNVWEWVQDFYGPYKAEAEMDAQGPEQGSSRVLRGGCWCESCTPCRSTIRLWHSPGYRYWYFGFRVVADVPPQTP